MLVEALGVERDQITPSATLQGELGAESIDFLDIVFRLEKEFGMKIPRGELFFEPVFQGKAGFVQDGHLTAEGLAALRSHMPYANLDDLERDDVRSTLLTCSRSTCWRATSLGSSATSASPKR